MRSQSRYRWFVVGVAYVIPKDIAQLRSQMRERADHERELQADV